MPVADDTPTPEWARDLRRRVELLERGDVGLRERRITQLEQNTVSQREFRLVTEAIADDVREIKEEMRAIRYLVRGSLISALSSIVVAIVLFFVLRGSP